MLYLGNKWIYDWLEGGSIANRNDVIVIHSGSTIVTISSDEVISISSGDDDATPSLDLPEAQPPANLSPISPAYEPLSPPAVPNGEFSFYLFYFILF